VAVRNAKGAFECLTGNQVATMLAEYRLIVAKRRKIIPEEGSHRIAILKTFVTSPMISKIAESFGVKCVIRQRVSSGWLKN
jgi:phosphoglucomutase